MDDEETEIGPCVLMITLTDEQIDAIAQAVVDKMEDQRRDNLAKGVVLGRVWTV